MYQSSFRQLPVPFAVKPSKTQDRWQINHGLGHVLGYTAPTNMYPLSLNWTASTVYQRIDFPSNSTAAGLIVTRYQCNASAEAWLRGVVERPVKGPFTLLAGGDGPVGTMQEVQCLNPPLLTPSDQSTGNFSQCLLWGTDFACGRHPSSVLSGFAVMATPTPSPTPPPPQSQRLSPPLHRPSQGAHDDTLLLDTVIRGPFAGLREHMHDQTPPPATTEGGYIVSYNTSTLPADGSTFNFTLQLRDQYGSCAQESLSPWNNASVFNLTLTAAVQCNVDTSVVLPTVDCCSPQVPPLSPSTIPPQRKIGRSFPIDPIADCGANFTGALTLHNPRQQLFSGAFCVLTVQMQVDPKVSTSSAFSFSYPLAMGNYTVVPGTEFQSTQNILIIVICTILGSLLLAIVARRAVRRTLGAITTFDAEQDFDSDRRGVLGADGSYISADVTSRTAAEREAALRRQHAGRVLACYCLWLPIWCVRCQCKLWGGGGHSSTGGGRNRSRGGRSRVPSWPPARESHTTLLPVGTSGGGGGRRSNDSSSTAGFSMKGLES